MRLHPELNDEAFPAVAARNRRRVEPTRFAAPTFEASKKRAKVVPGTTFAIAGRVFGDAETTSALRDELPQFFEFNAQTVP